MSTLAVADVALPNPHAHRDDVHHRLYLAPSGEPTVICVQWFDYFDYAPERFLTVEAYEQETDAAIALNELLTERTRAVDFAPVTATRLIRAGVPVSRLQALDAALALV